MKEKIKKWFGNKINIAKILILVSIFLPVFLFPFSSGYYPQLGILGSMMQNDMKIELYQNKGHEVQKPCLVPRFPTLEEIQRGQNIAPDVSKSQSKTFSTCTYYEGGYEISVPFKYVFILSGLMLFAGIAILVI